MTCRHSANDPACSSNQRRAPTPRAKAEPKTPDSEKYTIEQVERVGEHLVLRVYYPNCKVCFYEGNKVMVFLNVSEAEALKWRKIDPHFRDPTRKKEAKEAPCPAARFPASKEGWSDAIAYAHGKVVGGRFDKV